MTTNFHPAHEASQQGWDAPKDEVAPPTMEMASDAEVGRLESQIASIDAEATRIENQIEQMLKEAGGAGASSGELEHAREQAREMHSAAASARSAISSAPTDPKSGRKILSVKKVAILSQSIGTMIISGEKENVAIAAATTETENKAEALHEKGAAKIAESISSPAQCMRETVCVRTIARPTRYDWVNDRMDEMQGLSERVHISVSRHWHSFTASASSMVASIASFDVVDEIKHAGRVVLAAGNAVVATGSIVVAKVGAGIHAGLHAVKETAHSAYSMVCNGAHATKMAVLNAIDYLNPFKDKTVVTEVPKPSHGPILVPESAMEKALEQAKAMLTHGLPHISLPDVGSFFPASVPFAQGVMGKMALAS